MANKEKNNTSSNDVIKPVIGLNTDNNHYSQPENTYSFALNTVNESNDGDFQSLSNENSNELFAKIKPNFIILGSVYIGDSETCIFSVKKDNSESEIGILYDNNKEGFRYKTFVNDKDSFKKDKLKFDTSKQIQAIYRLIKGCEKVVYWTDNHNPVRQYNFNHKEDYVNDLDRFVASKFLLQKQFDKIPKFKFLEILENAGSIPPGTLTVCIQYSDSNKNFTNFISEASNIIFYKDNLKQDYYKIEGSINTTLNPQFQEGVTNKALKIHFENLDENYQFYRLAFIHYSNNILQPTEIYLSQLYSTKQTEVVYTGLNYKEKTTLEYIRLFNKDNKIFTAKTITQKDDRLLLGSLKNESLDFKDFQKLASKINVDCVAKKVTLNDINDVNNTKNPLHKVYGTGFQPGEVFSLGIVWVFEGNVESPVFHIPGKNNNYSVDHIFDRNISSDFVGVYPMKHANGDTKSLSNNISSVNYVQRENCNNFDYWGVDSRGQKLVNNKVRHHRFPTLKDINLDFYIDDGNTNNDNKEITYLINFIGSTNTEFSDICSKGENQILGCINKNPINIEFIFNIQNLNDEYIEYIIPISSQSTFENKVINQLWGDITNRGTLKDNTFKVRILKGSYEKLENNTFRVLNNTDLKETNGKLEVGSTQELIIKENIHFIYEYKYFTFEGSTKKEGYNRQEYIFDHFKFEVIKDIKQNITQSLKYSHILGVHLSNVELPPEDITGRKCLGYYIVKQSVADKDKTFLDSGVVLPLTTKNNFHTFSQACGGYHNIEYTQRRIPEGEFLPSGYSNKTFALLSPKHKFHDKTFDNFTDIIEVGYYEMDYNKYLVGGEDNYYAGLYVKNVNPQKTPDISDAADAYKDSDGLSLKCPIRFTKLTYKKDDRGEKAFKVKNNGDVALYNLHPISSSTIENDTGYIYNMDAINKHLIFYRESGFTNLPEFTSQDGKRRFPYVHLYNNHNNFYEDFLTAQYQKLSQNITSKSTYNSFNGDLQLGFLRKTGLNYLNTEGRRQKKSSKNSWVKAIVGVVVTAIALVATIFTAGAASPLLVVGAGLLLGGAIAYGAYGIIKVKEFNKAMTEHWEKGLKGCMGDTTTYLSFQAFSFNWDQGLIYYQDDTIRWFAEIFGDMLFETDINISLRLKPKDDLNNFLKPLSPYMRDLKHKVDYLICGGNSINIFCNTGGAHEYYWEDNDVTAKSEILEEFFILHKLCKYEESLRLPSEKGETGYEYRGLPLPELYFVNNDYQNQKQWLNHYAVPFEYSFCSECRETFPQRFQWSEVANQEQLNDNYKLFKANDYKDVSGEFGEIVNIFTFNNNLYIHTTAGLWLQPTNHQEQVLNDVTIYIGTGEFGSLPPQLIVEDKTGGSAGLQHREAQVLTPYGYFFISESERKVYKFDGKLEAISDNGMSKWFNKHIPFKLKEIYGDGKYYYDDNPSNYLGIGYILVYDKDKERIIITKKDFIIEDPDNIDICLFDNRVYNLEKDRITNILESNNTDLKQQILEGIIRFRDSKGNEISIEDRPTASDIFTFIGIENCSLKFESWVTKVKNNNTELKQVFTYVPSQEVNKKIISNGWTVSYSLKYKTWTSFHSYLPSYYIKSNNNVYSWVNSNNGIWKHNKPNHYQTFYDHYYPHIIEYVDNNNPLVTKIFDHIRLLTEAKKYNEDSQEFYDERWVTFNKAILYNSSQCSGELTLKVKDITPQQEFYLSQQVINEDNNVIFLDRNERDWLLNDFRDYRINYDKPIFNSNKVYTDSHYYKGYIDKILNEETIDLNKNLYNLESLRDKYLVIRLFFDNFADVKLIFNFTMNETTQSIY